MQPVDSESIPSRIAQQTSDAEVNERVGNVPLTRGEDAAVHPRTAPHFFLSSTDSQELLPRWQSLPNRTFQFWVNAEMQLRGRRLCVSRQ